MYFIEVYFAQFLEDKMHTIIGASLAQNTKSQYNIITFVSHSAYRHTQKFLKECVLWMHTENSKLTISIFLSETLFFFFLMRNTMQSNKINKKEKMT